MSRPVVVGVRPEQPGAVLEQAERLAALQAASELVCAWVDSRTVPMGLGQGSIAFGVGDPVSPALTQAVASEPAGFDPELRGRIEAILTGTVVRWRLQQLTGDPADALARLADEVDASVIVVGARPAGFGQAVHDLIAGSVAGRLAHQQRRPVLVVPDATEDAADPS